MGFWRDLWYGSGHDSPPADTAVGEFHSSNLQQLKVATALQNAAWFKDHFKSSAAYRGAMLLADLAAQVPWYAYQGGDPALTGQQTVSEPERLDVQPRILIEPSTIYDRDEVIRQFVLSLIFHGDPYVYGQMHVDGRPTDVIVPDPNEVTASWNDTRTRIEYRWRDRRMVPGFNWWHAPINRLPGSPTGVGPFEAGADIIAGIKTADAYAATLFQAGVPAGVLKVPGKMTRDEAMKLKDVWEATHDGGRGTGVLSGGVEFEAISITPEQSQFLMTRAYGAQEVSRILGIPQWFLNAGSPPGTASALTYQNLNQVFVELTRGTLYPTYLRRLEKVFSKFLPRGQSVKFDLTEFLATDVESRFDAYQTALDSQILSVSEVRAREGLPTSLTGVNDA